MTIDETQQPPAKLTGKKPKRGHKAYNKISLPESNSKISGAIYAPSEKKALKTLSKSRFSAPIAEKIVNVFDFLGGEQFLMEWAEANPTLFMVHFIAKMIPKDTNIKKISIESKEVSVSQSLLKMLTTEQLQQLNMQIIEGETCNSTDTTLPSSSSEAAMTVDSIGTPPKSEPEQSGTISESSPIKD